jgi:hypothetical protein
LPAEVEVGFGMDAERFDQVHRGAELERYPGNDGAMRVRDLALLGVDGPFEIDGSTSRQYVSLTTLTGDGLLATLRCVGWDMAPDPASPTNLLHAAFVTPMDTMSTANGVNVWWANSDISNPGAGTLLMPTDGGSACFYEQSDSLQLVTVHSGNPATRLEGGPNDDQEAYSLSVGEQSVHAWVTRVLFGVMPESALNVAGSPGACSPTRDSAYLFVRTEDGRLGVFQRETAPGTTWLSSANHWELQAALEPPAGTLFSGNRPAASCADDGSIDLVATGSDGSLWTRHYDAQTAWQSPWLQKEDASVTSGVSVVTKERGTFDVFARGSSGDLVSAHYADSWSAGWDTSLALTGTGAPVVRVNSVAWLDVFVRGPESALWTASLRTGRAGSLFGTGYYTEIDPGMTSWDADHLDVFGRNSAGELTRFNYDLGWAPWELGTGLAPPAGDLVAITRERGAFDVFVGSPTGELWHAIWPRPPGCPTTEDCGLAAVANGIGSETIIATWSGYLDQFGLTGANIDIAAVDRGNGVVNLVTGNDFGDVLVWRNDNGWQSQTLAHPFGVQFGGIAAANNGGKLEIVASTDTHELYYTNSTNTDSSGPLTFVAWTPIAGATATGSPNQVALTTSPPADARDAFWLTPAGNIGHANWYDGYLVVESGDIPGMTQLQPLLPPTSLDAIESGNGRIDLVLGANEIHFQHHWYDPDADGWGSGSGLHRETLQIFSQDSGQPFHRPPTDFAMVSTSPGNFDIFASDEGGSLTWNFYHSHFSSTFGWTMVAPDVVSFDRVTNLGFQFQDSPIVGLAWSGTHGVFGITGSSVGQMNY